MKMVDTHQHLWDLKRFHYSWCAKIPKLNRSFLIGDYRKAARDAGIVKTVFVECDVDDPQQLEEARAIQSLADRNPLIAGIIASGRPEQNDFADHLRELIRLPKLKGLRRVLHVAPDEISKTPLFADHVRLLARHDLTFDLCVLARQLPLAISLVKKCPRVRFVLDHCGVPDVKGRAFDPWRENIRRLAELPNVVCKVSGLVAYADPAKWRTDDLRPWVEHVLEHFGWKRVMWGSDWPVCTLSATLRQWLNAALELTAGESKEHRRMFFHDNAERIYHLKP